LAGRQGLSRGSFALFSFCPSVGVAVAVVAVAVAIAVPLVGEGSRGKPFLIFKLIKIRIKRED
jgi:hypothetical protein